MTSSPSRPSTGRTAASTLLAMLAFAANSILCRAALGEGRIDAASFTAVRIASGAATLVVLVALTTGPGAVRGGSWKAAGLLFLYAAPFSFAYNTLPTGTGALMLFGAVQATMLLAALKQGERPAPAQWIGLGLALAGLVYLVLPGVSAPPPVGSALMVLAGVGWGFYSLVGRGATDPLAATCGNFVRCAPLVALVVLVDHASLRLSSQGVVLAVASGSLASGLGYAVWYAALRGLTATRAATVQLSVPVLAAAGGVLFMGESIGLRLIIATALILGGVGLALRPR